MAMSCVVRPQARIDLAEIALYISYDNLKMADNFLQAAEETFESLAIMPDMGSYRTYDNPTLKDVRMLPVRGYHKHLIFYVPRHNNNIEIIRVLHSARDLPNLLSA